MRLPGSSQMRLEVYDCAHAKSAERGPKGICAPLYRLYPGRPCSSRLATGIPAQEVLLPGKMVRDCLRAPFSFCNGQWALVSPESREPGQ